MLPETLTQHLDLDALELVPGTYVDPNLSERQSDFLYRVQFADDEALLYVLLEHQSRADPLMAARLFVYLARVLDRWCADNTAATRVPALVPVVLYSGRCA